MQSAQVVQALPQKVAAVAAEVAHLKVNSKSNEKSKQQFRATICKHCQEANSSHCNHCFLCGSENHFASGCKQTKGCCCCLIYFE